ncbi:hypothetical protein B0T25DRAFT_159223 [Lasiosphaeria hispida]|uniref:CRIB domain-containing protein n=1 Tax=Lasiosphaeria hispida TaxID=260671 RepID=A0AAJ0MG75_9PEZI|nr:hypothetical protein B0T25DRAFT_159223 [Lasiosphaeria hispida]
MNMWAVSDLPVYSTDRAVKRKEQKRSKYSLVRNRSNQSATVALLSTASETLHHDSDSIRGLLGPAIDGPPSPESIRALSNQMKRSSAKDKDKHQSHQTTSSGSSSLRSLASADRPSWENALEGLSLSRKSSGRSTASSMPSRDRPESVQIFGKNLFSRRGKLRRDSNAAQTSSSETSLYAPEVSNAPMLPHAPTSAPMRDSVVPTLFGRRRAARLENVDESVSPRKFQISGPYNFQHVSHKQRDNLPDLQRTDRVALTSEFSQVRSTQVPAPGTLNGIKADDLHFADFSSDFLPLQEERELDMAVEPHTRIALSRPPSMMPKQFSPPRRLVKHTRSQEQLRMPPPRPPRSPIDPSMLPSPPIPPPRVSSRMSTRQDGFDSFGSAAFDRPQTSSGFRHPQPFPMSPETTSPPSTSHGYFPDPEMGTILEHSHSRSVGSVGSMGDENWPLPTPESLISDAPLPNVPEEDENTALFRQSRASIASNSSLRGSQSVPMLRPLSMRLDDGPRRPASNASDTLGRLDLLAAQRALKAALFEGTAVESLSRESWEDDIDYCYEHAVEAHCDYEWDRPSMDIGRDEESDTPVEDHFRSTESREASPRMLSPGQFDVPALSPVSQLSVSGHEAITPTLTIPTSSNFSLPRADAPPSLHLLHVRKPSDASSFKESHGFTLSPSLLIPNDYQLQMLAAEADARDFTYHPFDEPGLTLDTTTLQEQYRTSASTTGTMESTDSGFEKHVSATSSSTDFTRLSMSTSSLDLETFAPKPEPLHQFPALEPTRSRAESKSIMPTLPESEEAGSESVMYRQDFKSRSSESNLVRLALDEPSRRKESILARRQRARTTSLSTPPPPGQYALFPSTHVSGGRF